MSCTPVVLTASAGHSVAAHAPSAVVVVPECGQPVVVQNQEVGQVVVESYLQGPPGPPGDPSGALLIDNRLNEFAGDTAAQVQAQANLGLGVADPLAYYILAKS